MNNCMKQKLFPVPFLTISSNLIFTWCLQVSTFPIKMVPSLPPYDNFKIFPQLVCSSKSYKYKKYDKTTYRVSPPPPLLLDDSPSKPDHQAIHCPKANFKPLPRGSITNPMLITMFDTYFILRSPGAGFEPKPL